MSIEVNNVSKKYGNRQILDEIKFSVSDNEIVAFLGPNGAGKSTTLKIIAGFLFPDSGEVKINGTDIQKNRKKLQLEIGYLPENNPLYPEMYVKEYLEYVAGIYQIKQKTTAIERVVEQTGLSTEYTRKIGQLSKGYRQRVGIAQAIIHNPSILLLDEPTTGLDPIQLIEIRQLLKDLRKDRSILFSTHNLNEVSELCEHIVILKNGKIISDTMLDCLAEEETLEQLFLRLTK